MSDVKSLIERLRQLGRGRVVFRVQDKKGTYIAEFDCWEKEAAVRWWRENKMSLKCKGMALKKARDKTSADHLMNEAADELERQLKAIESIEEDLGLLSEGVVHDFWRGQRTAYQNALELLTKKEVSK
jgi:DNA-binding transcriptional regulator GbsR (MarR family)